VQKAVKPAPFAVGFVFRTLVKIEKIKYMLWRHEKLLNLNISVLCGHTILWYGQYY
jgi:hypothetical protein